MKIGTNLILLGILSMLVGTAFASPLLISELDIIPFPRVPEGPKADFSVSVEYANFTVQDQASNKVSGGFNLSILDYYLVLNVTNHSDLKAKVARFDFAAAKDITVVPSALGGYSTSSGDASDNGHGGAAMVEGVWLDGEWLNVTWVPEGGLDEIWGTEGETHPQVISLHEKIFAELNISVSSYGFGSSRFIIEGSNFWMEGVPLHEYIYNNEIVATLIYTNGSWIDVTGRVEVKEKPYVSATGYLLDAQTAFYSKNWVDNMSSSNFGPGIVWCGADDFNNTWEPHQSRLILLTGTSDVGAFWDGVESLKEGEITFYTGTTNYVNDAPVNGTYFNTFSSATELKQVQLEITEDGYLYNIILSDDQMFVMDSFGVEVFIEPRS